MNIIFLNTRLNRFRLRITRPRIVRAPSVIVSLAYFVSGMSGVLPLSSEQAGSRKSKSSSEGTTAFAVLYSLFFIFFCFCKFTFL